MKLNLIRNILPGFIGLLLLLTLPGGVFASSPGDGGSKSDAGGLKIELDFAAEPVKTGSNDVLVKLYDAAGRPIDGAEVMVVAAELLQADPANHDNIGTEDAHQPAQTAEHDLAGMDAHQPAPAAEHDLAGMDAHQPAPAAEHDLAGMDAHQPAPSAEHDLAEMDTHQPAQTAEHDLAGMDAHQPAPAAAHDLAGVDAPEPAAGHSGGHGEPAPANLVAGLRPGEYQGQVSFTDEGRWRVRVNISTQGRSEEAEFTVDVIKSGPNWYILGGFLGVNTLVVATAAVMKQRGTKARTK